MKTTRLLVLLISLFGVWQGIFAENQAYAVLDTEGTLTFYYDENKPASGAYDIPWDINNFPGWYQDRENIITVAFDASFGSYQLESAAQMFYNCYNLMSINFTNFNTESVTDMSQMFEVCSSLLSLDVSNFNTESVTDMSRMFSSCSNLKEILFSKANTPYVFITSNVTNMSYMFEGCSSLMSLDVSNFDTKDVEYMQYMFYNCSDLTNLKISQENTENVFKTEDVTNMSYMFAGCKKLENLNLSSFNTEKVTNMSDMFYNCQKLEILDLSNFSNSAVSSMNSMFRECIELKSVDIRNFTKAEDTYVQYMFSGCKNLKEIICLNTWENVYSNVQSWDHSYRMFYECYELRGSNGTTYSNGNDDCHRAHPDGGPSNPGYFTDGKPYAILSGGTLKFYYDLEKDDRMGTDFDFPTDDKAPGWTTSEYASTITTITFDESFRKYIVFTSTKSLFSGLSNLVIINNLNCLNTDYVIDMSEMFKGCSSLTSLDLSGLNTEKVTNMSHMFDGCRNLESFGLSGLNTENVTDMSNMFSGCSSLTSLDLSNLNSPKVTDMSNMFYGCNSLESLVLPNFYSEDYNSAHLTNTSHMFDGCSSLTSIDVSKINTEYVTDMSNMFYGCSSLESLDLNNFYIPNATNLSYMFNGCSSLENIYCSYDWAQYGKVTSETSVNMFAECENLPNFDSNEVTVAKANPRDGGYFSAPPMAYAYLNNHKLIFRYDDNWIIDPDNALVLQEDEQYSLGENFGNNVTQVIFEPSFSDFMPTTTANWFASMRYLESITGLEYLNTKAVTNMNSMFYGCEKLTSLDLTSFDVSKVTDMGTMFAYCSSLEMIYAGNWYDILNGKVYSSGMFAGCEELPNWDESNSNDINYAKPSENGGYFSTRQVYAIVEDGNLSFHYDGYNYQNTYTIDQNAGGTWKTASFTTVTFDPSFADYKLESSAGMFSGLTDLTTIYDLDNLNTSSIEDMSDMFNGCTGLTTIYCGKDWSGLDVTSTGMFAGCTSLVGAISYDNNKTDITYANPYDGYFSQLPQAYAVQKSSVLTFYYDNRINTHSDAIIYEIPWFNYYPEWTGMGEGWAPARKSAKAKTANEPITLVVFDPSFAGYDGLENTSGMFYLMESLTSIEGLEYLNTENVTTMRSMFEECSRLTSLNLTNFNVGKVEDMNDMFYGCNNLGTIFCNEDWGETAVSLDEEYGDSGMFYDCYSLKGPNGANYEDFMDDEEASYISYAHPDAPSNPGFFTQLGTNDILLYDSKSNTETISSNAGKTKNVFLIGRKLYKDGDWNTLCLPFNVNDGNVSDELTFTGTPLEGATVMTLSQNGTGFEDGVLSLNFVPATSVEAGKPYIVKWEVPEETDEYYEPDVIVNPFFAGITIQNVPESQMKVETTYVDFVGNFNPFKIGAAGDKTKLYLGANNGLYYPNGASTFFGFRAYFQLKNDLTAGEGESAYGIKAINLNFGEEENGIQEITTDSSTSNTYFTLDGRRLTDKPATSGIYILNGKKVMIK